MPKTLKSSPPLITIITIAKNNKSGLEKTIKSILRQKYKNIEYIVMDGASTDGSLQILKKYSKSITRWQSSPDQGIYAAMNKGINLAHGRWVNFMNAGDIFYNDNVLTKVSPCLAENYDLVYGNWGINNKKNLKLKKAGNPQNLWQGMVFAHTACFVRTLILKKQNFDTAYLIAADFDFFLKSYSLGNKFFNANLTISVIEAGGLSDKKRLTSILERWKIAAKYQKGSKRQLVHLYYSLLILFEIIKLIIKKILVRGK